MSVSIYQIIYEKEFDDKASAETFIKSHKKQDCFQLYCKYYPFRWIVKKTKLIESIA